MSTIQILRFQRADKRAGAALRSIKHVQRKTQGRTMTVETKIMTITPAIAQQWLDGATDFINRPLKEAVITKYARDMQNGVWQMNGEALKFTKRNGSEIMIDGQHRALACVRSGQSFASLVVVGVNEDSYTSMDSGTLRQPSDFLSRSGHQYVHSIVAAARMMFAEKISGNPTTRGRGSVATNQEILDVVSATPELETSAVAIYIYAGGHSKLLAPSISVYLHYRFGQIDAEWRDLFFEGLFVGAGLKAKSPILLLRNRLVDNFSSPTKLTSTARTALAIKAWNALIEDRAIAMLKWSGKKEKFPRIEGLS